MTYEERIEIAEMMAEELGGNVWTKGEIVRVYIGKRGYACINTDGVNIDAVNGNQFDDVKSFVVSKGVKAYRR